MSAVADDDDDNDNDEGIVKNTMWISTFMNAVDDNDDDNDSDKAFLGRPESAKSNGLFAQIDIWHQSISKNKVPETSICESVLHNLDTPPSGSWVLEDRSEVCIVYYIGKRPQKQKARFAGYQLCEANIDFLKK